jgi:hypothetical protein
MVLFRQRITCEGWQGENSAGVGKTLPRVRSGLRLLTFTPFSILTLVAILGAALRTIWIPRMLEFSLSIVDAKGFLGCRAHV